MIRTSLRSLLALAALSVLSACASIPAPLAGDYAPFLPNQATERSVGAQVRWGGHIVDTQPLANRTCVEILARDLDREFRPMPGDVNHGRFLACRAGFQDPAVFANGREVTIIGSIEGFSEGEIGEFIYRYPRLDAEVIYLWPVRPDMIMVHDPWWPHHDPWWPRRGWYGPRRSHWSGTIIIRR